MPASTLDPVNAALRTALSKSTNEQTLDTQLAGATKKALLSNIEFEQAGSYQNQVLNKLKTKYIVLKTTETPQPSKPTEDMGADETLKLAKYELYPLEAVQLGWKNCDWSTGAGMVNMGNTCYLNSTLQALFHVPALANWLMSDTEHTIECQDSGGCIICAMRKTLQDSQRSNTSSIRPLLIYNKLRLFWRNMIPGRQEDAHEFLRYLVEGMEKAYLSRFKNHTEFDSKIKETTPLNQILGGYLRSAVRCLRCAHVSTTFQHFQDLLLDIRKATTLDEALELYFSREKLDDESYQCESCHKKVPATKQFSLARTPMVLCIQLKRFSVSNNKITKHIMFRQRLDLTKYACQRPNVPLIYRLVALVTHMGPTVGCGHYTAVAQAPSGIFYQFDDSTVRQISHQAVFSTNAYIMLYELESTPYAQKTTTVAPSPAPTCSKVYGPELPPERNGHVPTKNGNGTAHTQNSDSDSESESDDKAPPVVDTNKKPPTPTAAPSPPTTSSPVSTSVSSLSSPDTPPVKSSTKLVPYESDDTNSSDDSSQSAQEVESRVSTKAAVGEWQVTSTTDAAREPSGEAGWETTSVKKKTNGTTVVNELFKMSHGGYAAPVQAWNGTRSQLDKEVSSERREERKRALQVDETEQGRVKHPKISSICKSNPGYNPIQEFHNSKNWSSNGSGNYNKQFFSGGNNRHRRNFHHKNYNKNYRYRQ